MEAVPWTKVIALALLVVVAWSPTGASGIMTRQRTGKEAMAPGGGTRHDDLVLEVSSDAQELPTLADLRHLRAESSANGNGKDPVVDVDNPSGFGTTATLQDKVKAIPRAAAPVTSAVALRLRLSPAAKLYGVAGEVVNVEFFLTNQGKGNRFAVSVQESSGLSSGGSASSTGVSFPLEKFVSALSQQQIYVNTDGTQPIVLTLKVPESARIGTNRTISLSVTPYNNPSGSSDVWVQRFYFSVDNKRPEDYDKLPPVCLAKEHNFKENCHTLIESGGPCSQGRWNGKLQVHDVGSGLRAIEVTPQNREGGEALLFFSQDNFIVGTKLPVDFVYGATCCTKSVAIASTDNAHLERVCSSDGGDGVGSDAALSSASIAVIVVVVLLVIVVVVAVAAVVVTKRRQKADLASMRMVPGRDSS